MMYSSVEFYGRDPSVLKGGGEKSQFTLVNLTGPTRSHKPDTICQKGFSRLGRYCRCCYFMQVTFLLWKQSVLSVLRFTVCTGVLLQLVLKSQGCREGCFSFPWISYLRWARADTSLAIESNCRSSAQHQTPCAANRFPESLRSLKTLRGRRVQM